MPRFPSRRYYLSAHYIEVQFERNLPFERLKEIIGPLGEPTSRPQIEFSVDSRAQRIEIKPEQGQNWGELVGFALGSFDAKRGAHYTLTADVRSADPDLRTLNGQLFVRVHPMTVKEFYMLVLYSKAVAIILAVIAAIVFLVRVARSRAADTGAAPSRSSAVSYSMSSNEIGVILKRFESPDEVRVMQKGKFKLVAHRRDDGWARDLRAGWFR